MQLPNLKSVITFLFHSKLYKVIVFKQSFHVSCHKNNFFLAQKHPKLRLLPRWGETAL